MKIDDSAPMNIPTSCTSARSCRVPTPRMPTPTTSRPMTGSSAISDVLIERIRVWFSARFGGLAVGAAGQAQQASGVLLDLVEHDDRVVQGEAEDGEQTDHRRRRHLEADERVHARGDDDVVEDGDERARRPSATRSRTPGRSSPATKNQNSAHRALTLISPPQDAETALSEIAPWPPRGLVSCARPVLSVATSSMVSAGDLIWIDALSPVPTACTAVGFLPGSALANASSTLRRRDGLPAGRHRRHRDLRAALEVDAQVEAVEDHRADADQQDDAGRRCTSGCACRRCRTRRCPHRGA